MDEEEKESEYERLLKELKDLTLGKKNEDRKFDREEYRRVYEELKKKLEEKENDER
ncbi:MAG: hypothetical protein N2446_01360 [Elusimicrobiales bacterium]|nr:hypothetical protein [Elusimicrobiales bacterium]